MFYLNFQFLLAFFGGAACSTFFFGASYYLPQGLHEAPPFYPTNNKAPAMPTFNNAWNYSANFSLELIEKSTFNLHHVKLGYE